MDVRYVNPIITSTVATLKTMAGFEATRGTPFLRGCRQILADVSGIIELSGQITGAVVLSFSFALASSIYQAMTGVVAENRDPAIPDAVGELANMVAGGTKTSLQNLDMDFRISLPSVVVGPGHSIARWGDAPCLIVPFELGREPFWVQVSLKIASEAASGQSAPRTFAETVVS